MGPWAAASAELHVLLGQTRECVGGVCSGRQRPLSFSPKHAVSGFGATEARPTRGCIFNHSCSWGAWRKWWEWCCLHRTSLVPVHLVGTECALLTLRSFTLGPGGRPHGVLCLAWSRALLVGHEVGQRKQSVTLKMSDVRSPCGLASRCLRRIVAGAHSMAKRLHGSWYCGCRTAASPRLAAAGSRGLGVGDPALTRGQKVGGSQHHATGLRCPSLHLVMWRFVIPQHREERAQWAACP